MAAARRARWKRTPVSAAVAVCILVVVPWLLLRGSTATNHSALGNGTVVSGTDPYYQRGGSLIDTDGTPVAVQSRFVSQLHRGTRLVIYAESEVTNDISLGKIGGYDELTPATVTVSIVLSRTRWGVTGPVLERLGPTVITPSEHHHTFTEFFSTTLHRTYLHRYVNVVMSAALDGTNSTSCVLSNDQRPSAQYLPAIPTTCALGEEPGYGELSVLRLGTATVALNGVAVPATVATTRRWSSVSVSSSPIGAVPRPVMSVHVPALMAGDILVATSAVGARLVGSVGACTDMLGVRLWLAPRLRRFTAGAGIDAETASNLYSGMPSEAMSKAGAVVIGRNFPHGAWVLAAARSDPSSAACATSMSMAFAPAASNLTVVRYTSLQG